MKQQPPFIVLASASPRRKQLLQKLGLQFEIRASNLTEEIDLQKSPSENVMTLAVRKAQAIADQLMLEMPDRKVIVLGGDTMVVINDQYLGQPKSAAAAIEMLQLLSGKWHEVFTGVALVQVPAKTLVAYEVSRVKLRKLSMHEIESYVKTGEPMDAAGSYALQGLGAALVEKIEGCVTNVIGFPLPLIVKMLADAAVEVNYTC